MSFARVMLRSGLAECSALTARAQPKVQPKAFQRLMSTRPTSSTPLLGSYTSAFRQSFKRNVQTYAERAGSGEKAQPVDWQKVGLNVGLGVAAAVGLNFALNRETRDALSTAESAYLNSTYKWTGLGLGITAVTAKLLHSNGFALRLMGANPWVVMIAGVGLSIGSMMGVYYTAPDSPAHYLSWAAFTAMQGVTLSPMFFLNPAVLSRAGLYTLGAVGGLSYVGATAKNDQFLYIGGPLMAGLGVLILTGLAPMVLPRMSMRAMTTLEYVGAYGGAAVFSGLLLYDTQKVLAHARLAQQGRIPNDPIRESVSLVLDIINLFTSIVRILMLQQGNRRK